MDWALFIAGVGCGVLGFCAGVWWTSRRTIETAPGEPEPEGVHLHLFGKDTFLHSQQTRVAGTEHPSSVRKPHGGLAATTYDLVGIVKGVGVYRER